jgi:hypothetical protein
MDPISFSEATPQLVDIISSRAAVLVIGAGASITSGGPSAAGLTEIVKKQFPLAEIEEHAGLLDAFTEVCYRAPGFLGHLIGIH